MATIRPATLDDIEAVRWLLRISWHDTYDAIIGPDEVAKRTTAWHSIESIKQRLSRTNGVFLVAEERDVLVGMAFATLDEEKTVELYQLYVLPDHKGQGIGSGLMSKVHERFADWRRTIVDVEAENRAALRFYEALGFKLSEADGRSGDTRRLELIAPAGPA